MSAQSFETDRSREEETIKFMAESYNNFSFFFVVVKGKLELRKCRDGIRALMMLQAAAAALADRARLILESML